MSPSPAVRHAHVAELPSVPYDESSEPDWTPLRHLLGVRAFGVNAFTAQHVGDNVVEAHDEDAHEELYVVIEGEAEFTVGDEMFATRPGSVVFVSEPSLRREARATVAPARVLAIGAEPGAAFEPSDWEARELGKAGL